ncbi:hypothetical protein CEXT_515671 [Caerostris extrusa]|uniref:Uncharacterized protein n=1 Tax=Caerostris extrusa TaxID=172846 RepID=A0AAV4MNT6_CAEEX|nr:hypothetical protein CEXT_515671 [Caerostris extrusa]
MERKSKVHKYLQICVGDNPSPMLLKLNKDNTLEIKFNSKNKKQNSYHRVWIPRQQKLRKDYQLTVHTNIRKSNYHKCTRRCSSPSSRRRKYLY